MKKNGIIVLVAIAVLAGALPSWGESVKDLNAQLKKNSKSINTKMKQLNGVKKEKKEISHEIEVLDRQIDSARMSIEDLKKQISDYNQNIEEKEAQINQAEEKMKNLEQMLKARIVALYKNGESTYLEMILDADSFSDFFARYHFVKSILEQDKELLESTAETREIIQQAKTAIEKQKKSREAAKESKVTVKRNLDTFRGNRSSYLRQLSEKQKNLEVTIDEELKESDRLKEKIKRIQKGSKKVYSGGVFHWPIDGSSSVKSYFGMRMHPILKKKKMHTGVDIWASSGTDIVAVSDGTVIMADWFGGYGKTVIIDHGSGKSTLYAHTSKILVSEGAEVKAGKKIAEVGSTGLSTGPHLHFEVRENGTPVNPLTYISK
ncbi:MAG: murein hydrolase activator EnvC family protein [Deltaproteobacteria bacterium]